MKERVFFAMKFKITTEIKEKKFLISIAGNLDTSTYQAAEQKIDNAIAKEADGTEGIEIEEIIMDLKNLVYISSLGLRILFKLSKRFPGKITIINVPSDVMDIFKMTGIDKTMTVRD